MNSILLQVETGREFISVLLSLGFAIILFLVFRGIMLWYWRVNDIINNQQRQIEQQQEILKELRNLRGPDTDQSPKYDNIDDI